MNLSAVRQHFARHPLHMAGCLVAAVFVVAAAVYSLPVLAILGALLCGGMMLGMVWMMVRHGGHHN